MLCDLARLVQRPAIKPDISQSNNILESIVWPEAIYDNLFRRFRVGCMFSISDHSHWRFPEVRMGCAKDGCLPTVSNGASQPVVMATHLDSINAIQNRFSDRW